MLVDYYITGSCVISNNAVFKNENLVFSDENVNPIDFFLSVYKNFNLKYSKFYKMDNLSKLGWISAEILLHNTPENDKYKPEDWGIVLTNANASLDTDIKYYDSVKSIASPALFVYTLPSIVIGEICIRHNLKGENSFFIFEQFDSEFIYNYVRNLLDNDLAQVCICGWVDLLGDRYKSVFYLVEKDKLDETPLFTTDNINKIYDTTYGSTNI